MSGVNFEAALLCLLASLAWAPLVYLTASRLDRGRSLTASEMLWLTALGVAALPTLIAPALAAVGFSLRPAPVELAAPVAYELMVYTAPTSPDVLHAAATPQITATTMISAASLLYIYGVLLAFGVWLTRSIFFGLHVRRAESIDHPELMRALEIWRRWLAVEPKLQVRTSDAVSSVCVYGIFHPVIIVPSDLNARVSFNDLVMMCAHELAHVKRGDCRLFAASAAARILFWFNPFVKRIAARAELAAEQSADALVLDCGADRRAYAACFVEGLRFAAERAQVARVAVPSFTPFDRKSRRDRLDAILSGEDQPRRTPSRLAIGMAAALAGALAVAQAAIAVQPAESTIEEELFGSAAITDDDNNAIGSDGSQKRKEVDVNSSRGADVKAPANGVVIEATDVYKGEPGFGKVVVIKHSDGLITRFTHLDNYSVSKGDRIKKGEKIAEGSKGSSTGPLEGDVVDPAMLPELASPVEGVANVKPVKAVRAVVRPRPEAEPATPVEPAEPLEAIESLDLELAGAPKAPRSLGDFKGFAALAPDLGGGNGQVLGDGRFAWNLADGHNVNFFDDAWSEEDREALEESLADMRKRMAEAKAAHAAAMEDLRLTMKDLHVDGENIAELSESVGKGGMVFSEKDRERLKRAMREAHDKAQFAWEQHRRDAEQRARDRDQAKRDREQALRDQRQALLDKEQAKRDREQASRDQAQARRDREQAARDRDQAQREAWAEREAERVAREIARAEEIADREAERAALVAEREAERLAILAEREAERAAERAEREAELAAEQAEREAQLAAEQAEREAERAAEQAEREAMEEARAERREMLELREQALEEAERELEEERAEIEQLRYELDNEN